MPNSTYVDEFAVLFDPNLIDAIAKTPQQVFKSLKDDFALSSIKPDVFSLGISDGQACISGGFRKPLTEPESRCLDIALRRANRLVEPQVF